MLLSEYVLEFEKFNKRLMTIFLTTFRLEQLQNVMVFMAIIIISWYYQAKRAITFRYEMHLQERQQQVNCNFVFVAISFSKVNAEYEVLSQNSHAPVHTTFCSFLVWPYEGCHARLGTLGSLAF